MFFNTNAHKIVTYFSTQLCIKFEPIFQHKRTQNRITIDEHKCALNHITVEILKYMSI